MRTASGHRAGTGTAIEGECNMKQHVDIVIVIGVDIVIVLGVDIVIDVDIYIDVDVDIVIDVDVDIVIDVDIVLIYSTIRKYVYVDICVFYLLIYV